MATIISQAPAQDAATRIVRSLRRRGPLGFLRTAVDRAIAPLTPAERWEGVWVWYQLELASSPRPRLHLEEGLELREGHAEDARLMQQLPPDPWVSPMDQKIAARRLASGHRLWLVRSGEEAAFACWSFRGWAPVYGARRGRMEIAPGVVLVEDLFTWPAFRGRGIASAVLSTLAERFAEEGAQALMIRVHVPNAPSHRTVQKVGFREVARMQIVERDWRKRIRVAFPPVGGSAAPWLASLNRG